MFLGDGESSRGKYSQADRISKRKFAAQLVATKLGARIVHFGDFPDNAMDSVPLLEIVRSVEEVVHENTPSLVLTHWHGDLNIDHQITARAVLTATRPEVSSTVKRLLAFSVPSSTEWSFSTSSPFVPNTFIVIDDEFKVVSEALTFYSEELRPSPHPRSVQALEARARLNGELVGVKFAEAFVQIRSTE
jgi:LmbE family N-acetylglucosaminyl deacetylase